MAFYVSEEILFSLKCVSFFCVVFSMLLLLFCKPKLSYNTKLLILCSETVPVSASNTVCSPRDPKEAGRMQGLTHLLPYKSLPSLVKNYFLHYVSSPEIIFCENSQRSGPIFIFLWRENVLLQWWMPKHVDCKDKFPDLKNEFSSMAWQAMRTLVSTPCRSSHRLSPPLPSPVFLLWECGRPIWRVVFMG